MLTGFLKRRGHIVIQRDLNVAFYDHVLSSSYLSRTLEHARSIAAGGRMPDDDPEWLDLLHRAVTLGPLIVQQVDRAKAELRDAELFYDAKRYARNFRLIHRACDMISAVFPPSRITPIAYTMGFGIESLPEILAGSQADDRIGSSFLAWFSRLWMTSLRLIRGSLRRLAAPLLKLWRRSFGTRLSNPCRARRRLHAAEDVA
jgi:hypothetical protein